MSEFYTGKSVIKDADTGGIKAYELSKDSYEYLEYEAKRAIGLEKRVEELEEQLSYIKDSRNGLRIRNKELVLALEAIRKITVQDYFKTDIYIIATEALEQENEQ